VADAFFHDIGKTRELAVEPGFPYAEEGALLGHIALGYAMVEDVRPSLRHQNPSWLRIVGYRPSELLQGGIQPLSAAIETDWMPFLLR
jgi:23S rRNA maturation-related 3'-5' exoribonuclease YhaM